MNKLNLTEATDFKSHVDSACFEKLNKSFFAKLPESKTQTGTTNPLDSLASNLISGLDYFKRMDQVTYSSKLNALSDLCKKKSMSYEDVKNSIVTEIILKGQLFKGIETDFSQALLKSILDEKKKIEPPHKDIKLKYIDYKYRKIEALINSKLRNPKELEKILYADGKLLALGQTSFDQLAAGNADAKLSLSQAMLKELFQDSKTGGFADQFAKYQLVSSIGIAGVSDAVKGANDSWFSYISSLPEASAKKFFNNPSNIESVLGWESINDSTKKRFESKIFLFGVLPQTELASFNAESVETKIYKTYYPAYHTSSSNLFSEMFAKARLSTTVGLTTEKLVTRFSTDLNNYSLTTESADTYKKIKIAAESEAESLMNLQFKQITGNERIQMKSYLTSQILSGVVAKDGKNLVDSAGVEKKITDSITNMVKTEISTGISNSIDRSMQKIERGPKY